MSGEFPDAGVLVRQIRGHPDTQPLFRVTGDPEDGRSVQAQDVERSVRVDPAGVNPEFGGDSLDEPLDDLCPADILCCHRGTVSRCSSRRQPAKYVARQARRCSFPLEVLGIVFG